MDNASSLAAAGASVAQNDKDLAAEWSRSSFDVRHRFSGDFSLELPFGQGRKWLNQRGVGSTTSFGGWMMNGTISVASGSRSRRSSRAPSTDVANGVNGTLRANYNGDADRDRRPDDRLQFFNTSAFSIPSRGDVRQLGRATSSRARARSRSTWG